MQEIRTETIIEANADEVWAALSQLDRYPAWNPFVREISGEMQTGARLEVLLAHGDRKPTRFRPTVTAVEHGTRFSWLGHLGVRGLFDGHHVFELFGIGEKTRLVHREEFTGILAPLILPMIRTTTAAGFEAMNQALKTRVETTVAR